MSDHAYALAGAFQACGSPSEVLPESNAETVQLGRKYTSGKECYPCILTTGNMIKATKRSDFKPDQSAFLMFSSNGPCRFGQYSHFQRLVLDELGFHQVPIFGFNQDDRVYQELKTIGNDFSRLTWQGIVAIDLLDKKLRETRPYENHSGETNHVYQHYLRQVFDHIKNKKELTKLLRQARKEFEGIPINRGIQKPLIGIVGEIYVRSNPFSNENIVGQIESLGGEVWLPPVGEWISYTNFTALRRTWENGGWSNLLKTYLTNTYQQIYEHKLSKIFATSLKNYPEPSTGQTIRNASPYLDSSFEGEAILSVGKAIDFIRKGVHGIISVMPFTCMPGTIVNTLLKQFQGIEKNIPVLTMSYDGQEQTNTRTRLEAFMHQVGQFKGNGRN
jgi:predicted nucleotide-binding protein (sugar kinase/HSP70/actin superfamily)